MSKSIYLINPAPDFPSYSSSDVLREATGRGVASFLSLAAPVVAAMIPDDFKVTLCEENVTPIDFDAPVDYVGITGMVSQWQRMKAIAREFRKRGRVVIIGGPQATLRADDVRPHCQILVRGEIEEIADGLFEDLRTGNWKTEYVAATPQSIDAPLPRLDLYPNERTLTGAIQTSRGCPFGCEFCEAIQYQGRKQRHKPIPRVLEELDQLHTFGYRQVFIIDDNLTASRKHAKELLEAIKSWNRKKGARMTFVAQVSIDAASDEDLLRACADAGVVDVFVGIETPSTESLREVKKFHNTRIDIQSQIERFVESGIGVTGGMIVGFDSDGPDIFERQYEFAMATPIPFFTPAALFAPDTTPLFERLRREGRVAAKSAELPCTPWTTNVIPKQLSREELAEGLRWLVNKLYHPRSFTRRVRRFVDLWRRAAGNRASAPRARAERLRPVERECLGLLTRLPLLGLSELMMSLRLAALVLANPRVTRVVVLQVLLYLQARYLFERGRFWDPALARLERPSASRSSRRSRIPVRLAVRSHDLPLRT
jgi:hypothetical protein